MRTTATLGMLGDSRVLLVKHDLANNGVRMSLSNSKVRKTYRDEDMLNVHHAINRTMVAVLVCAARG